MQQSTTDETSYALTDTPPSAPPAALPLARYSPYDQLDAFVKQLDNLKIVAEHLCKSTLLPRAMQAPANLQMVLAQGLEMGFTPMQAIRASFIIESKNAPPKIGYYVEGLVALVRKSGVCRFFRVEIVSAEKCRVVCARKDEDEGVMHVFEISMAEAQKSNLDKKWEWDDKANKMVATQKYTWITAPSDMLRNRTSGRAVKSVFQDVIFGMATPDELDDVQDAHVIEMMESGHDRFVAIPEQQRAQPSQAPSPPAKAVPADAAAIDTSKAVDVQAEPTADASSGDTAWDGVLVGISRAMNWPHGNIAHWSPDDLKEKFDQRAKDCESRKALNALGLWISELAKAAGRSKTCADVASHLRDTFNTRNEQLRKSEATPAKAGAA